MNTPIKTSHNEKLVQDVTQQYLSQLRSERRSGDSSMFKLLVICLALFAVLMFVSDLLPNAQSDLISSLYITNNPLPKLTQNFTSIIGI
jgi:hypothetical protein